MSECSERMKVASDALLAWAIEWTEGSPHRPWCNVADGNIYSDDSGTCSCGRDCMSRNVNSANIPICVYPKSGTKPTSANAELSDKESRRKDDGL